eukprot:1020992-Prymnesium_polylepis.1
MAAVGISWTATNGPNDARKKRSNDCVNGLACPLSCRVPRPGLGLLCVNGKRSGSRRSWSRRQRSPVFPDAHASSTMSTP